MITVNAMDALCRPRSLALIGASSKTGRVGNIILENVRAFPGDLYLVSASETSIGGRETYPDVAALPAGIDLAVIALEAKRAVAAARQCAEKGCKVLIIVASGYSEIGREGADLEQELREHVVAKGTRILGPNTLGVFIPGTGLDTIFVEHGDRMFANPGEVAFVTQSGSVGVEALGVSGVIGWGLRAFVGMGNRIDIGENDLLPYFAADAATKCIALYLETFQEGDTFLRLCREITPHKPIVVLKAGRSDAAMAAVASHTGKMASAGSVFSGAGRQAGVHLAEHEEQLADYAKVLSREPAAENPGVAVVTSAGGYGIITLDLLAETTHLECARLSEATEAALRGKVPAYASLHNPIDLTASADNAMTGAALEALEEDDAVGIILCIAFFAPPKVDRGLIDVLVRHRERTRKPFVVFVAYGPFTNEIAKTLYERGVVSFTSLSRAVRAMDVLAERGRFLRSLA